MKKWIILIMALAAWNLCLQAQPRASILTKKITLKAENTTVRELLKMIEEKAGFTFSYSDDVVPVEKRVSYSAKEKEVSSILNDLFRNEQVVYSEVGGQVVLFKKKEEGNKKTSYTISGYVSEAGSGELLPAVNVLIPSQKTGTSTNNYGFYSITLPADTVKLVIAYVGYTAVNKVFLLEGDITLNLQLKPDVMFEEVVVTADKNELISENPQMSKIEIPVQQIKDIPALLGEKDVLKVVQLMPGVQKGSEGQSGFYVRGGGPDQNLIILDDATVYNAFHLFGFFSLFNGDALKSVELTKGGFPARYGGRLSSVLEMTMKEGNKEKFTGEAGIGILSSRLTLEGPLKKGKSSFLVSGRRTYFDILARPFMPANQKFGYFFYDLNAKVNYDLGQKNKVYLSGYFGNDKFFFKDSYSTNNQYGGGLRWGNATATARWNHLFNNKVFSNTSVIFSNYKLLLFANSKFDNKEYNIDFSSGIRDIAAKFDLDYSLSPGHTIRAGTNIIHHTFTPNAVIVRDDFAGTVTRNKESYQALEGGVYVEDHFRLGSKFRANAGLRLSYFGNQERVYVNPEPRFAGSYMLGKDFSVKASYAMMNQYIHLLSNTGVGLPTDLWVPSTKNVKPQQSNQVALGLAKDFRKQQLFASLEGYYKTSNNIIGYREGASFLAIDDPAGAEQVSWQDNVTSGKGWSYGMEFLLQKKKGRFTGWIGYTLSWTQHQFADVNFGKKYYARYDRRHDISVVGIYKISDHITLSATWVYGTGNAITLPQAEYTAPVHNPNTSSTNSPSGYNQWVNDYGAKNDFRMAAYHRADIGIQFHKKINWGERTFELSFYNFYNRKNPFFYYVGYENGGSRRELKQVSLFPIIPSVSYSVKF